MHLLRPLAVLATALTAATAYDDNCKGNLYHPRKRDCLGGINAISTNRMYPDKSDFSTASCHIIYKGKQDVDGQVFKDTALRILRECASDGHHGSFGTNQAGCGECHVKVNFQDQMGGGTANYGEFYEPECLSQACRDYSFKEIEKT